MMTPLDDDLLTTLRAARPDPEYQPSATSPEARAMLARIVQARHRGPRLARRWRLPTAPGRPLAGRPATRRRRIPAIIISAAMAAALAAAGLTLLPRSTSGASPTATQLLAKIATAAAAQPSPHVRDSQFWYIKSWVSYQACSGGSVMHCVMEKPHERQIWQSVSNECITGLLREYGNVPLKFGPIKGVVGARVSATCPYPGNIHDPTYRFLESLPTNPRALLSIIEQQMQGQLPRPEEAFATIGDLLREAIAPPGVSAALYRAAALIAGVTAVPDATDAIGRHGIAVAFTFQGVRTEWIFNKQSLQYLGENDISLANGASTGEAAVVQRAFVDHAGQLPG